MIIASIMTGTSVDGVDISIRDFHNNKNIDFFSYSFTQKEQNYIKSFLWPNIKNMAEISEFNFRFSKIIANYFLKINENLYKKIDYVVFHGQTTFHDPNMEFSSFPSTMQLGNGGALATFIKKNVISDLRSSDIAAGGQGAPLVVYGDKELFWDGKSKTLVFNIGGISNVSIIDSDGSLRAYDLGMGNALIDMLVNKWFNLPYDIDGKIGAKGELNCGLLSEIKDKDLFLMKEPPKSTGKEKYNINFLRDTNYLNLRKVDVIHTLEYHIALTVLSVLKFEAINNKTKCIIAGGGVLNKIVMNYIRERLPNIILSPECGIAIQEREATAFSVLGKYYIENKKIGSTTNSKTQTVSGCLYKFI